MGGDNDYEGIYDLVKEIKHFYPKLKVAMYSGRSEINYRLDSVMDYYKVGP